MKRVVLIVTAILTIATGVQAKNQVYGQGRGGIEGEGYKVFVSDKILDTVYRTDNINPIGAVDCNGVDENTSKNLGDISTIRSDKRLAITDNAKPSYSVACRTYSAVVDRLKSADDVRKLWLLFGDSATDDFAVDTMKNMGISEEINDEVSLLIELKRLAIVSKYIEFFTTNKEWKLTDYTFLSQAFKARKDKKLSPAYSQFIEALLTGDTDFAYQCVKSINIENLGSRFIRTKVKGADQGN